MAAPYTTNFGNQTLTYDYLQEATSQGFNKLNKDLFPTGIYTGLDLDYVNASTIRITPGVCFIEDTDNDVGVRVETTDYISINITPATDINTPFIVLRFQWQNVGNNFMGYEKVALADVETNDLIVGRLEFNAGGSLLTTFDTTRRNESIIVKNESNQNYFKVYPTEPPSNQVIISSGIVNTSEGQQTVSGGTYPAGGISNTSGSARNDIIYIDKDGNILVEEDFNKYNSKKVIAEIRRSSGRNNLRGSEIFEIETNKNFPRQSLDDFSIVDEFITVNEEESGSGVTDGLAGLEVKRGTETNQRVEFQESDDTWRTGEIGSTLRIANIEDSPTSLSYYVYDSTSGTLQAISKMRHIRTQAELNSIIERVSANNYKINDDVEIVFLENLSGGFQMAGGTSALSGGDTYMILDLNNCTTFSGQKEATLDFSGSSGGITITSNDSIVRNVILNSDDTATTNNAINVTADNCLVENIKLTNWNVGDNIALIVNSGTNDSWNNIYLDTLNSTNASTHDSRVFQDCNNLKNIYFTTVEAANTSGGLRLLQACNNIVNLNVSEIDTTSDSNIFYIAYECSNIHNVIIDDFTYEASFNLFENCENIDGIKITNVSDNGGSNTGRFFYLCKNISNIHFDNTDGTLSGSSGNTIFHICERITNVIVENITATSHDSGNFMYNCDVASNILIKDYSIYKQILFYGCENLTNIKLDNIDYNDPTPGDQILFYQNQIVSDVYLVNITFITSNGYGVCFEECNLLTNIYARNIETDRDARIFYDCDIISNVRIRYVSGPYSMYGFYDCNSISSFYITNFTSVVIAKEISFQNCNYIAAGYTNLTAHTCDYVDTNDTSIGANYSTPDNADNIWDP